MDDRFPDATLSGPEFENAQKNAEQVAVDLRMLREDLAGLSNTVKTLVQQKKDELVGTARGVSASVASQVSDTATELASKGQDMANAASQQVKTFASEVESMGRANPLGAMAAALLVGVLIGLIGRGRH